MASEPIRGCYLKANLLSRKITGSAHRRNRMFKIQALLAAPCRQQSNAANRKVDGVTAGKTSNSGESEERTTRLWRWVLESWPQFIFWTGLLSFGSACLNSERLPLEAVLVGPL